MHRYVIPFLVMSSICWFPAIAAANDSTAEIAGGGLILLRSDTVTMEREALYISPDQVRVEYVFRNNGQTGIESLVAFPMPVIAPADYTEGDLGVQNRDDDNFVEFSTTANGLKVEPELEMRALSYGLDITDELKALSVPLNPLAGRTEQAIGKLPAESLAGLQLKGAIHDAGDGPRPGWSLRSTYFWRQSFPAGEDIEISHRYRPVTGASFYWDGVFTQSNYRTKYCIDKATEAAIRKSAAAHNGALLENRISYVLTTGGNWAGPIKDFRLVIDKLQPAAVVSFCMDGVKKIAPTQFEIRRNDFIPERDLDILIYTPPSS